MDREGRALVAFAITAAVWHFALVYGTLWEGVKQAKHTSDFASFYYAARVALDGEDPYRMEALTACRDRDLEKVKPHITEKLHPSPPRRSLKWPHYIYQRISRDHVYPYLYPPPFLLSMGWVGQLGLLPAYRMWMWISEGLLWLGVRALWRWWRRFDRHIGALLVISACVASPVIDSHCMGQMNLLPFAIAALGLWLVHGDSRPSRMRQLAGGALVGAACMVKLSPALIVIWWLVRWELKPVLGAGLGVLILTGASILVLGADVHQRFIFEVLPGFVSGSYHGLDVSIGFFSNSSMASAVHELFPAEHGAGMSAVAQVLWLWLVLALSALLVIRFASQRLLTPAARASQFSAVAMAMLLLPLYAF